MTKIGTYGHRARSRMPSKTTRLIILAVIVMIFWSSRASLDEVVRGPGKVVPISQTQIIQSLEGGILADLTVWEGKEVMENEVVATLSDNRFKGAYEELETKMFSLESRLIRLEAEMKYKSALVLPSRICATTLSVCKSEKHFFNATRQEYMSTKTSMEASISAHQREVDMKSRMAQEDILPELELLEAKQTLIREKANFSNYLSEYQTKRSKEYADVLTELNSLKAQMGVRADQLLRTSLRAPVRSIVNKIMITTIGGVVAPGDPILELTPLDDELRIEAKINPKDVAFIRSGMRATVKLTAYDYSIFGAISGTVNHISADTFEDPNQRDPKPYYKVFVSVSEEDKETFDRNIDIRPGMIADVELHTGEKQS